MIAYERVMAAIRETAPGNKFQTARVDLNDGLEVDRGTVRKCSNETPNRSVCNVRCDVVMLSNILYGVWQSSWKEQVRQIYGKTA